MIYDWSYRTPEAEEVGTATALAAALGVHPVLGKLLVDRGIHDTVSARKFFRPKLTDLHQPMLMNDMGKAVARINEAIARGERILVYGDYDVDGVTAVALVYKFLRDYTANIDYYIPDRYNEGYGIGSKGIDFAADTGTRLIIVLDCGIKAVDEVAYAKSRGIDFIICDHHVPDTVLPAAVAILNPKRADNTYPYEHLSGCGVGFKLMQALAQSRGIEFNKVTGLLDLCAVSIASDIVPVTGENRILAHAGLHCLNATPSVGLRAIVEVCGLADKELSMSDIIFKIGPRINASGRVQNGRESVRLLVETDYAAARAQAESINLYNEQRKELDKQMTEEAITLVRGLGDTQEHSGIAIYNKEWHKGVIGIVASRLVEQFHKPAVVLTVNEGYATGSARSVGGFDVYAAVQSCADILENFGGHTYAAGMTMRVEHVEEFRRRFLAYVDAHISEEQTQATLEVNGLLELSDISFKFYQQLARFAPFGPGNEKPVFCTRKVYDYGTSKVVGRGQEHIKLELVGEGSSKVMNGIAFGQSSQARYIKTKRAFDICYTVEENSHKRGEVQLQIEDIRPCE
ncbi:MAG: single-stranded-DNA-specific exonuclease RecJ [Bacteroidaceae bacterium]|nr:single-stranded-DNA-specific exonuclease RecJ [Bacteroidaceae bacterium]